MGMETKDFAERAFAQAAVLNIVVQGILETLTPDQVAKIHGHLLLAAAHQEAHLVGAAVPDAVPTLFASLVEQMQSNLRAMAARS